MVIGLFYLSYVSHILFEHKWLPFQHSSQLFSASSMFLFHFSDISLTNCPCILLFFHSSFFSLIQLCLNSFLFNVSLYSIVSAAFTLSINNGSIEFLTYHPKFFYSILIYLSQLTNPLLPISLPRNIL